MRALTSIVVIFSIFNCVITLKFKSCDNKNPDFNQCISKSAEDFIKQLKNPAPELGIPSLEALHVTNLVLPPMSGAEMKIVEGVIEYMVIYGLTHGQFSNFNVNLKSKTVHFEYVMQNLTFKSLTDFKGTLYSKEFDVKERLHESYYNSIFNITINYDDYEQNGDKFYKIVDSKLLWTPGNNNTIYLEEEDGLQKVQHISSGLQEHLDELLSDSQEAWDTAFKEIVVDYFSAIFSKIPTAKLFM